MDDTRESLYASNLRTPRGEAEERKNTRHTSLGGNAKDRPIDARDSFEIFNQRVVGAHVEAERFAAAPALTHGPDRYFAREKAIHRDTFYRRLC